MIRGNADAAYSVVLATSPDANVDDNSKRLESFAIVKQLRTEKARLAQLEVLVWGRPWIDFHV